MYQGNTSSTTCTCSRKYPTIVLYSWYEYSSTRQRHDIAPHQGLERSDIHYSSGFLRQCKASGFEGGIRVPGLMHYPALIRKNLNITSVVGSVDVLPTVMELLGGVESDNPTWATDGLSLIPLVRSAGGTAAVAVQRPKPMGFWWWTTEVIIDGEMKLVRRPQKGQCRGQSPYNETKPPGFGGEYLFNLTADFHEMNDLRYDRPKEFERMGALLDEFLLSVQHSQINETGCALDAEG